MQIIVAGIGKVGRAVAVQLCSEGHDVYIIDTKADRVDNTISIADVVGEVGNCVYSKVLESANVKNADLLIAITNTDEQNLLCCMTARYLNSNIQTIARIRNPQYYEQIYSMQDTFGLTMSVNPEQLTATEIERLIKYPGFLKRESYGGGLVQLAELKIKENSKLDGVQLKNLNNIIKAQILVCCVRRGENTYTPDGEFTLKTNDRIFITGSTIDLEKMLKSLDVITRKIKNITICGGGTLSYYLAKNLFKDEKHTGINVKIIENDPDRCVELSNSFTKRYEKVEVYQGDASDLSFLHSSWIDDADAVVALTGIDELNMLISSYASVFNPVCVITKLGRTIDDQRVLDTLPLGSVVSPKDICCDVIVRHVRAMERSSEFSEIKSIHFFAGGKAQAVEFLADETTRHLDEQLKDIKLKKGILISSIIRSGKPIYPDGLSTIQKGDTVLVVCNSGNAVKALNNIFE